MKKRKTYEISVIDKTYSKTISDETKFYTSDTALELGFELKETDYTFKSAEIVLLNIDDRSLVTRPVSKVEDGFAYEIDDDITTHYGDWRGQLRFEQAGEIYVSSPVKFRIENDLGNERPPQLSDVQSWVSLKRYADGLTEELKQAVLSIEGIEDTFNENETERQNRFETAEQSRQDAFEDAESERDETFESNETTRQAQELEREEAETARKQAESQREVAAVKIESRQTFVENQFNDIKQEMTEKDVISAPEIIEARSGYNTLDERLDKEHQEVTTQLAQTPTKDETGWANLNTFDEATRTVIQGLEPGEINAVLGIGNVVNENLARDSVTEFNASFIKKDDNLFNTYIDGISLSGNRNGGVLRTRANKGTVTAIIPVSPNTRYTINKEISDRFRVAAFSSSLDLNLEETLVDRFIKDETDSDESKDTSYSFRTNDREIFVAIYVSTSGEKPVLSMYESQEVRFPRAITSSNIKKGKNLFDGEYVGGYLRPSTSIFLKDDYDKSAILPIKPNTTYTISKEESNRFRVALFKDYPDFGSIADELVILDDEPELEYTFNSGEDYRYVVIQTTSREEPPFMQVEENAMRTSWESYGYKIEPVAKPVLIRNSNDSYSNGSDLNVEDFRVDSSESDSTVIQRAFDQAHGQVVSFESGKKYEIDTTVIARVSKVRGIKGNNATLILTGDIVGLKYEGTLSSSANPENLNNKELDITEGNAFIERLKVTSKEGHVGTGIEVEKLLNANIESCHTFNLKYGLTIKGRNRNLILSNCHIRDNFQAGLFLDAVDLHQLNMTGMHIAYSRNPIYVLDSHIYNWQMVGSDIESSQQVSYGDTESVIHIGKSIEGSSYIREVSFSGLTIQDHNSNTKPMINIELDEDELSYFSFGTSHMSNTRRTQPLLYIKGGNRINISNLALKNDGLLDQSFVFGNEVKNLIITGSNIEGEIEYADVQKLIIANNITHGFNLEDTRNENTVISNNLQSM